MPRPCINTGRAFWIRLMLAGAFFFLNAPAGRAGNAPLPFSMGETLHYTVRWEAIPAGEARFTVLEPCRINGEAARHFLLEISSNRFVDWMYKIRDRLEGFSDTDLSRSLEYRKKQTGKEKKEIQVVFDWEEKTATYANNGGKRPPLEIPENTFDPLSAFYKMRTLNFEAGKSISFPITDGKKQFMQEVQVASKETLSLDSGTYDTLLLIPQVNHFSGVFEKSKDASVFVWVTDDARKIPVRIEVEVFIGSVIFDLDEISSHPAH